MLNYVIYALHEALTKLDGRIHEGQMVPYDFEPLANHAIAKNIRILVPHITELKNSRNAQLVGLVPPGDKSAKIDRNDPRVAKMERDWIAIINADVPVEIFRVAESLFHFDRNPVPLAVQKALAPILIDVPQENFSSLGIDTPYSGGVQRSEAGCACGRSDAPGRNQDERAESFR